MYAFFTKTFFRYIEANDMGQKLSCSFWTLNYGTDVKKKTISVFGLFRPFRVKYKSKNYLIIFN